MKGQLAHDKMSRLLVCYGPQSELYSFPKGHPMNNARTILFGKTLARTRRKEGGHDGIKFVAPRLAKVEELELFHTSDYIELVRRLSRSGDGYLDFPDTPAFPGVYDAASYVVGGTLNGLESVRLGDCKHFFNPVGGLHHATRNSASGFCVFNDAAIAISKLLQEGNFERVAYVDIDAHHGDGVYYAFESDPRVINVDIHESGRTLFPGTGDAKETGKGRAKGTKLNIPLPPGSGDEEFKVALDAAMDFLKGAAPQFLFFQCGADGLNGDPLTHLRYSPWTHAYASKSLHEFAHIACSGNLLAMGGGGYNPVNVDAAWSAVIKELTTCP
jgi:acetoin utilization protein AcuC